MNNNHYHINIYCKILVLEILKKNYQYINQKKLFFIKLKEEIENFIFNDFVLNNFYFQNKNIHQIKQQLSQHSYFNSNIEKLEQYSYYDLEVIINSYEELILNENLSIYDWLNHLNINNVIRIIKKSIKNPEYIEEGFNIAIKLIYMKIEVKKMKQYKQNYKYIFNFFHLIYFINFKSLLKNIKKENIIHHHQRIEEILLIIKRVNKEYHQNIFKWDYYFYELLFEELQWIKKPFLLDLLYFCLFEEKSFIYYLKINNYYVENIKEIEKIMKN